MSAFINVPLHSLLLGLLPCLIPPYAIRLNRVFGTQRVGWGLVTVFSLLAVLQVFRAWQPVGSPLEPGLTLDLLNFLVPLLLLVGMIHIESVFKERMRLEQEQARSRAELEQQVRDRTADLDRMNEELQREITLRRQGEEELRKSKEQYRFVFDENPQPMWIFDLRSLRFLAFNSAALRHYGYSGSEFRELTAKDLCLPGDLDAFVADCKRAAANSQARNLWHHRRKDGSQVEVELTALDLTYGGVPARLILAKDVSAQRLLQKELLTSQRLSVTNQLAGGVADNFNLLITAIEGDAGALLEQCHDSAAVDPLRRIAATAACATALNRQLLALVRRHPMHAEPVDLNNVIENQSSALGRLVGDKIKIEKICWADLPPVNADVELVEQILRNLVLNACDAMPNGGSLTLSTTPVQVDEARARRQEGARSGEFVCLTVSDTGCGMTPEVQARLFEPFFTTKANRRATGLGLATVHGLVQQHAGWIEVHSRVGEGSRFSIFLPVAAVAQVV